jgi:hypothetical protein
VNDAAPLVSSTSPFVERRAYVSKQQFFEMAAETYESSATAADLAQSSTRRRGTLLRRLARLKAAGDAVHTLAAGNQIRSASSFLGPAEVVRRHESGALDAVAPKAKRHRREPHLDRPARDAAVHGVVEDFGVSAERVAAEREWAEADARALALLAAHSSAAASSESLRGSSQPIILLDEDEAAVDSGVKGDGDDLSSGNINRRSGATRSGSASNDATADDSDSEESSEESDDDDDDDDDVYASTDASVVGDSDLDMTPPGQRESVETANSDAFEFDRVVSFSQPREASVRLATPPVPRATSTANSVTFLSAPPTPAVRRADREPPSRTNADGKDDEPLVALRAFRAVLAQSIQVEPTRVSSGTGRNSLTGNVPVHLIELIELLEALGVPYVMAPSEADATCGFLSERGIVDAIMTEDSDVFLFGARYVLRGFFAPAGASDHYGVSAHDMRHLERTGITRELLIAVAMVMGSDYTKGVKGFTVPRAIDMLANFADFGEKAFDGDNDGTNDGQHPAVTQRKSRQQLAAYFFALSRFRDALVSDFANRARACRPTDDDEPLSAADARFTCASWFVGHAIQHHPVLKDIANHNERTTLIRSVLLPGDFPDPRIAEAYTAAPVVDEYDLHLSWGPQAAVTANTDADWIRVRDIASVRCGWSQQELVQRVDAVRSRQVMREEEEAARAAIRTRAAGTGQRSIVESFGRNLAAPRDPQRAPPNAGAAATSASNNVPASLATALQHLRERQSSGPVASSSTDAGERSNAITIT